MALCDISVNMLHVIPNVTLESKPIHQLDLHWFLRHRQKLLNRLQFLANILNAKPLKQLEKAEGKDDGFPFHFFPSQKEKTEFEIRVGGLTLHKNRQISNSATRRPMLTHRRMVTEHLLQKIHLSPCWLGLQLA